MLVVNLFFEVDFQLLINTSDLIGFFFFLPMHPFLLTLKFSDIIPYHILIPGLLKFSILLLSVDDIILKGDKSLLIESIHGAMHAFS